ncbi:MAG: glutathione S-transferase family protein [Solirubrobacteraceae bacterium MAG38_C4-C5]|nr:glutathione S-transferase family protein [Candidatus Siliceabacter maunaloa]
MLLYDSGVSGNCYKVRLLFAHLGLAYERCELSVVDRSNRSEVLGDLNPALRVPTVVLDEGRALAESNAILWYFADSTPYLPSDAYESAQVLQWLCFEQYSHEPNIAVLRFWLHYATSPPSEAEMASKQAGGQAALQAMDRHLAGRTFFVGERYSIADIALYAYTHAADEAGFDLAAYPSVGRWLERVSTQNGHVTIDA